MVIKIEKIKDILRPDSYMDFVVYIKENKLYKNNEINESDFLNWIKVR